MDVQTAESNAIITSMVWQAAPTMYAMNRHTVHVWRVGLDQPAHHAAQYLQMLSPDEHNRAGHFATEETRSRWIVGRGVLRMVLGRYLDCGPTELVFDYGVYGKPRLGGTHGRCGWQFNVAHSYTRALIAVAYDRAVGVDIEYVRPIANIDRVIKDVCTVNEQALLQTLSPHKRSRMFFDCWTRKEAIVKATGRGLTDMPNQINVVSTNKEHMESIMIGDGMGEAAWNMRALAPGPGYVGAIAAQGQDWHPVCCHWS